MKYKLSASILALAATLITGCGGESDSPSPSGNEVEKTASMRPLDNVFGVPDANEAKTRNVYLSIASGFKNPNNPFRADFMASKFGCRKYGASHYEQAAIDAALTTNPKMAEAMMMWNMSTACNPDREARDYSLGANPKPMLEDPKAIVMNVPMADDTLPMSDETFDFTFILDRVQFDVEKQGYKKSIREDIFNDGYASIVDVLKVAAEKYDLDVDISWEPEMGTWWINSINGIDGMDRSWMPSDEHMLVPFGECKNPGGWKAVYGNAKDPGMGRNGTFKHALEEVYQRLDEFYVQTDSHIMLIPACQEEKELRKKIYAAEQQRKDENGGKVIIPEFVLHFYWDQTAVFKNIEVKPHNLRNDIFKPGVLTQMDAILSLGDHSPAVEVAFNVWPKLSTGIMINGYVMNYLSVQGKDDNGNIFNYGHDSRGVAGWNYHAGEYERLNDTSYGTIATFKGAHCGMEMAGQERRPGYENNDNQSIRFTLPGSACAGGDGRPGSGTWQTLTHPGTKDYLPQDIVVGPTGDITKGPVGYGLEPYQWGKKTPYAPLGTFTYTDKNGNTFTKNRAYYPAGFGGNALHVLSDLLVMTNPEYFEFYMNSFFGGTEELLRKEAREGKHESISYSFEPIPPELDPEPFDVTSAVAPLDRTHFGWGVPNCKTCHQDGANKGHVAKEMKPFECAGCHGNNGAPVGHGEQNTCGFCHASKLKNHGNAYTKVEIDESEWNPVTDPLTYLGRIPRLAEYWGVHTDFPEPASCMTCHPSTNNRFVTPPPSGSSH